MDAPDWKQIKADWIARAKPVWEAQTWNPYVGQYVGPAEEPCPFCTLTYGWHWQGKCAPQRDLEEPLPMVQAIRAMALLEGVDQSGFRDYYEERIKGDQSMTGHQYLVAHERWARRARVVWEGAHFPSGPAHMSFIGEGCPLCHEGYGAHYAGACLPKGYNLRASTAGPAFFARIGRLPQARAILAMAALEEEPFTWEYYCHKLKEMTDADTNGAPVQAEQERSTGLQDGGD